MGSHSSADVRVGRKGTGRREALRLFQAEGILPAFFTCLDIGWLGYPSRPWTHAEWSSKLWWRFPSLPRLCLEVLFCRHRWCWAKVGCSFSSIPSSCCIDSMMEVGKEAYLLHPILLWENSHPTLPCSCPKSTFLGRKRQCGQWK